MHAFYLTAAQQIEEFHEAVDNGKYHTDRYLDASLNLIKRLEELPQTQNVQILITHLHLLLSEHKQLSLQQRKTHLRQGVSHSRVTLDPVTRKMALEAEKRAEGIFYLPE